MRLNWAALRSASVEGSGGDSGGSSPAPSGASPAPETGGGAPSTDSRGVSAAIVDIMNFDPFDGGETTETPSDAGSSAAGADTVAAAPAVEPPAAPPVDPLASTVEGLRQTVEGLPDAIRAAATPPAPAPAEPDRFAPMADGQPLNYMQIMSTIPEAALAGLRSENPVEQKQAVSQILGVAMHVAHRLAFKQTMETVQAQMSRVLPEFVSDQIRRHDTMRTIHDDFYQKFPTLNHPALKSFVMAEAGKLAQQLRVSAWDQNFRDRLGEHVMRMLPQVGPAAAPAMAPATPTMGPSARPMNGAGTNTVQQEIADLLF